MPKAEINGNAVNHDGEIAAANPAKATPDTLEKLILEPEAEGGVKDEADQQPPTHDPEGEDQNVDPEGEGANEQNDDESQEEAAEDAEEKDPDGEDANGDDDNPEDDAPANVKFTPEQQEVFNRELKKERVKTKAAKDEILKAQNDLQELKTVKATLEAQLADKIAAPISQDIPLANLANMADLSKQEQVAWDAFNWASQNEGKSFTAEDGTEYAVEVADGKNGIIRYTKEQLTAIKNAAHRQILKDIPERKAYLTAATQFNSQIVAEFPQLADPADPISVAINNLIVSNPSIKRTPTYKLDALKFYLGDKLLKAAKGKSLKVLEEIVKTAQKPAVATITPKTPPSTRKPPTVSAPSAAAKKPQQAQKHIVATKENIEDIFARGLS